MRTRKAPPAGLIGMYVIQIWPFHHPYAARTWTLAEWQGYAKGLQSLGYNTLMIWPMLETMPDPLLPSDRAQIEKLQQVIDLLHDELEMHVYLALSPNVAVVNEAARVAAFEQRHFYPSTRLINPGDRAAVDAMLRRREQLLAPLAQADGVVIIDSDPGGYPGSTNREFVDLLVGHWTMLDRLRPGTELVYWMWQGWEPTGNYYATGNPPPPSEAAFLETLTLLAEAEPEPWGLLVECGLWDSARRAIDAAPRGVSDRAIALCYGRIELEPAFPMTNFGSDAAYHAGCARLSRGVMGNAQTHCIQLPNTFAFARGALGQAAPTNADYVAFADRLIVGQGQTLMAAWTALAGTDSAIMRQVAAELEGMAGAPLKTGDLRGLLFGSPERFVDDLVLQLRMKAAYHELALAVEHSYAVTSALAAFLAATECWQRQHGYQCWWPGQDRLQGIDQAWPGLDQVLRALQSAPVDHVLNSFPPAEGHPGVTPFERIKYAFENFETYTSQLIEALRQTLAERRRER